MLPGSDVKQTVNIEIAGAKYRLTTDADPAHLERLADLVNERVAELGPKALRSASPAQLLAVVALGLAEDLERAEAVRSALESSARTLIDRAIARIDQRLAEDDAHDHDEHDDDDLDDDDR